MDANVETLENGAQARLITANKATHYTTSEYNKNMKCYIKI